MIFMATHEFGVLKQFKENTWYDEYEPDKYNCITVDMQLIDYITENYLEKLTKMKAYANISSQPCYGLEEDGITLIPPQSLKLLRNLIIEVNLKVKSIQLNNLISKIEEALQSNSYLIHFGV